MADETPIGDAPAAGNMLPEWLLEPFRQMDRWLSDFEKPIFEVINNAMRPFNQWMNSLPPIVWHLSAVGLFALTILVVMCIPRRFIYNGAPDSGGWRDLRVWTAVALVPYMVIYYFL